MSRRLQVRTSPKDPKLAQSYWQTIKIPYVVTKSDWLDRLIIFALKYRPQIQSGVICLAPSCAQREHQWVDLHCMQENNCRPVNCCSRHRLFIHVSCFTRFHEGLQLHASDFKRWSFGECWVRSTRKTAYGPQIIVWMTRDAAQPASEVHILQESPLYADVGEEVMPSICHLTACARITV
jgi:hypothetical protein